MANHALRANMQNLLHTNMDQKETVMRSACYCIDAGTMIADAGNGGFTTRMGFFRDGSRLDGGDYVDEPRTFIGKKIKGIIK